MIEEGSRPKKRYVDVIVFSHSLLVFATLYQVNRMEMSSSPISTCCPIHRHICPLGNRDNNSRTGCDKKYLEDNAIARRYAMFMILRLDECDRETDNSINLPERLDAMFDTDGKRDMSIAPNCIAEDCHTIVYKIVDRSMGCSTKWYDECVWNTFKGELFSDTADPWIENGFDALLDACFSAHGYYIDVSSALSSEQVCAPYTEEKQHPLSPAMLSREIYAGRNGIVPAPSGWKDQCTGAAFPPEFGDDFTDSDTYKKAVEESRSVNRPETSEESPWDIPIQFVRLDSDRVIIVAWLLNVANFVFGNDADELISKGADGHSRSDTTLGSEQDNGAAKKGFFMDQKAGHHLHTISRSIITTAVILTYASYFISSTAIKSQYLKVIIRGFATILGVVSSVAWAFACILFWAEYRGRFVLPPRLTCEARAAKPWFDWEFISFVDYWIRPLRPGWHYNILEEIIFRWIVLPMASALSVSVWSR